MLSFNNLLTVLINLSAMFLGCAFNSWTVGVNIRDWRRGRRLSPSDHILSFMAGINILLQMALSMDMSLLQVFPTGSFRRILISLCICLVSCNLWVTIWLCTYYCLKIVNFSGRILLALKIRISGLLPKHFIVFLIPFCCTAILSHWNIYVKCSQEVNGNSTLESSKEICVLAIREVYLIVAFVFLILPLLLTLVPIGVTLASLWRHMRRIKKNQTDSCHPQTQAHIKAARTMILLVILQTVFYGAVFAFFFKSFNVDDVVMFICWYFILFYPVMQSFVIITGNAKLWKACKRIFSLKKTSRPTG